ncbi:MAG: hypothetical protein IT406_03930 [Candidatus Yanofskybacteria bacterium]|nr:hypothetical protein [Candidatus Yanofskybacteria bacterium]
MKVNPEIFRAYDIRGEYGVDFDAVFAQRCGSTFAAWLRAGPLIVGRDARSSSDEIAYALIDGAVHAGAHVIDIGVVSTPQFTWAIRAVDAVGGVMVTASHNPGRMNGFKVIARRGEALEVVGGHMLRQVCDSHDHPHRTGGDIEHRDIIPAYADAVAYAARWSGGLALQVALDAPDAVRRVLERLGPIAPDHRLAARCDADGDRIEFFDEGVPVPADLLVLLMTEQLGLHPVVFDGRFSRTVRERLNARSVPYFISRVGRLYLSLAMRHTGAALGGELSGHFYWREFGGMESPELTLLRVYGIVQQSGRSLQELIAPYRIRQKSDEVSIPIRDAKDADARIRILAERFADAKLSRVDGLTVEYADWWGNVRRSNTEPVLRLVVEADTKDLLDQKVAEFRALLGASEKKESP